MSTKPPLDFHKAFHDVDAAANPEVFDTFLEAIHKGPMWVQSRAVRGRLAAITPGEHVLDAGCGVGLALQDHAAAVGAQGQVTGLDYSQDLLARARDRTRDLSPRPVLQHGDLQAMPFANDSFDVVWSERVWMYLDKPLIAAREALRVLKTGGRLVVGEIDLLSAWSLSQDESIRKMTHDRTQVAIRNPEIARQLPGLCFQAGFADVRVEPTFYVGHDFAFIERASNVVWHLDRLVDDGLIDQAAAQGWLNMQRKLSAEGRFVSIAIIPNVVAIKS